MQGILHQRRRDGKWTQLFCRIKEGSMLFYRGVLDDKPVANFSLKDYTLTSTDREESEGKEFVFKLAKPGVSQHILAADDERQYLKWLKAFEEQNVPTELFNNDVINEQSEDQLLGNSQIPEKQNLLVLEPEVKDGRLNGNEAHLLGVTQNEETKPQKTGEDLSSLNSNTNSEILSENSKDHEATTQEESKSVTVNLGRALDSSVFRLLSIASPEAGQSKPLVNGFEDSHVLQEDLQGTSSVQEHETLPEIKNDIFQPETEKNHVHQEELQGTTSVQEHETLPEIKNDFQQPNTVCFFNDFSFTSDQVELPTLDDESSSNRGESLNADDKPSSNDEELVNTGDEPSTNQVILLTMDGESSFKQGELLTLDGEYSSNHGELHNKFEESFNREELLNAGGKTHVNSKNGPVKHSVSLRHLHSKPEVADTLSKSSNHASSNQGALLTTTEAKPSKKTHCQDNLSTLETNVDTPNESQSFGNSFISFETQSNVQWNNYVGQEMAQTTVEDLPRQVKPLDRSALDIFERKGENNGTPFKKPKAVSKMSVSSPKVTTSSVPYAFNHTDTVAKKAPIPEGTVISLTSKEQPIINPQSPDQKAQVTIGRSQSNREPITADQEMSSCKDAMRSAKSIFMRLENETDVPPRNHLKNALKSQKSQEEPRSFFRSSGGTKVPLLTRTKSEPALHQVDEQVVTCWSGRYAEQSEEMSVLKRVTNPFLAHNRLKQKQAAETKMAAKEKELSSVVQDLRRQVEAEASGQNKPTFTILKMGSYAQAVPLRRSDVLPRRLAEEEKKHKECLDSLLEIREEIKRLYSVVDYGNNKS